MGKTGDHRKLFGLLCKYLARGRIATLVNEGLCTLYNVHVLVLFCTYAICMLPDHMWHEETNNKQSRFRLSS